MEYIWNSERIETEGKKDGNWPKEEQWKWGQRRKRGSQTHGYQCFFLLLFWVAFTFGQPAFHVVRQAFVAVLTHWLQIHLDKLIPDRAGRKERWRGKRGGRADKKNEKEKKKQEEEDRRGIERRQVKEKGSKQEDKEEWWWKGGEMEKQAHRDTRLEEKDVKNQKLTGLKTDS